MTQNFPLRTAIWHFRKGGLKQVREWKRRQRSNSRSSVTVSTPKTHSYKAFDPMYMPDYPANTVPTSFPEIRVAVIMDDFSLDSWSNEFSTVELTPAGWKSELADNIDFVFVESAWAGNHGKWQYQLTGPNAPSTALRQLLQFCADQEIPTVFWNKEDPPHFEDFLETAKLFDFVFTTDSNKIPDYRAALGHDRVAPLIFAAQPTIHNPIRLPDIHQRGDVAFAGMYFAHKYPERRAQMDLILGAAADVSSRMKSGLSIYSRHAGGDPNYQFPTKFEKYTVGALPYSKMLTAYRAFKVFLNVNSVVDSPSMCARRVFEITASGTPVVSTPSAAIPNFFPQDEVPIVSTSDEAAWTLRALVNSVEVRDRMVHRAQRRIWNEHTYTHRAAQVLEAIGLASSSVKLGTASVTAMVSTNRPNQIEHVLEQVGQQQGVDLELALLTHGFEIDEADTRARARELGIENLQIIARDQDHTLGDCLNALVGVASGDYIAKMDDDDLYGPNYLLDQTNIQRVTSADVVGKQAIFLYLGGQRALLLRSPEREHRWSTFVSGATLTARAELFRAHPFAPVGRGEDSDFLTRVVESGASVYSSDRFNFVAIRHGRDHTWDIADTHLMANGRVEAFGLNTDHVFV